MYTYPPSLSITNLPFVSQIEDVLKRRWVCRIIVWESSRCVGEPMVSPSHSFWACPD